MHNPDHYAATATAFSKAGLHAGAFNATCRAVVARADWVLVNGNWCPRRGILRDA